MNNFGNPNNDEFMNYIGYLEANDLELDEHGNVVPKENEKEKNLSLGYPFWGEDDE